MGKTIGKELEGKKLNLDTFGEVIDKFLTDNECMMLFTMPEGTQDITISDNMHGGSVLQLYFLLKALPAVVKDMFEKLGGADEFDREGFMDGVLEMVRDELMEDQKGGEDEQSKAQEARGGI